MVGEITGEGTIGLLIFGGLLPGALGGLVYITMRKWIPGQGLLKGLAFGTLLLMTFGSLVINSDNVDFFKFGNPSINVLMFALLFPMFGILVHLLAATLDRLIPTVRSGLGRVWMSVFINYLLLGTSGGPRSLRFSRIAGLISRRRHWFLDVSYIEFAIPSLVGSIKLSMSITEILS